MGAAEELQSWRAGPFRVVRKLARGHAADLFLAEDPENAELRVVRVLRPEHTSDPGPLERCLGEAARLHIPVHPGCEHIVDAGRLDDGRIYLATPYVSGTSLRARLRDGRPLSAEEAVALCERIGAALDALHAVDVMHGHLDAGCVLLDEDGSVDGAQLVGVGLGPFSPGDRGGTLLPGADHADLALLLHDALAGLDTVRPRPDAAVPHEPMCPGLARCWPALSRVLSGTGSNALATAADLAEALRAAVEPSADLATTRVVSAPFPLREEEAEAAPEEVGSYRIHSALGEGAMGRVYRAEHRRNGRHVALKLLRREHLQNPELLERFFREARAVNQINHPHIVSVFDFVEERGPLGLESAYCVMELLEGKTLSQLFREAALDVRRTVRILSQVCEGLEAAHLRGVVHRDVKPDNIFVTQRNGRDFVKVLDFGVAKLLPAFGEGMDAAGGLPPATVIGTPNYMAPEQAAGRAVSERTDLYAVGVVLYEMLAGRRPHRSQVFGQLVVDLHTRAPAPLPIRTPRGEWIGEPLTRIVHACLERDPERRPASAVALAGALEGAVAPSVQGLWANLRDRGGGLLHRLVRRAPG